MIRPIVTFKEIEEKIIEFAKHEPAIDVLGYFGSRLDDTFDLLSDLDYFIITENLSKIQMECHKLNPIQALHYKDRSVLYFRSNKSEYDIRKVDLKYIHEFKQIFQFLKSTDDFSKIVLVDKIGEIRNFNIKISEDKPENLVMYHINRFVEAFESCSVANQSSDRYRFLFHQMIALQHLYTLEYMNNAFTEFNYLPLQLTKSLSTEMASLLLNQFDPNSELKSGRITRKKMLAKFEQILKRANDKYPKLVLDGNLIPFLTSILKRDWFWNIRDIADINPNILQEGILMRSSSLSYYQDDEFFHDMLNNGKIKSIIDLRYLEEVTDSEYKLENVSYYNIPIGAKHVKPDGLKYTQIGVDPFFYEYFPRYYHTEITKIFRTIIDSPKPTVIHCHAGKDRTGIIVAMIQKLVGLSDREIQMDYLTSRSDTIKEKITVTLTLIEEFEGIENYLSKIGLSSSEIDKLRTLFQNVS